MIRPAVLYIGGSGRSGSTLLARMVGQQPGFAALGELRYVLERGALENHLCGCGAPFRDCPFWTEVFGRVLGGFDRSRCEQLIARSRKVDRIRYAALMAVPRIRSRRFRRDLREHAEFLVDLYSAIADVAGIATIVDSSKDPSYAFLLRSVNALDVSVLHLVRDSRAVAYSWTRSKVRPEIHWKVEYMQQRPPLRSALKWSETNLLFEAMAHQRGQFQQLRYEEFTTDPDHWVAEIARWARRSMSRNRQGCDGAFRHDLSGNPIRFSAGASVIAEDEEWRARMPIGQRRLVTTITAPLLARYGYRLDGNASPSHTRPPPLG